MTLLDNKDFHLSYLVSGLGLLDQRPGSNDPSPVFPVDCNNQLVDRSGQLISQRLPQMKNISKMYFDMSVNLKKKKKQTNKESNPNGSTH